MTVTFNQDGFAETSGEIIVYCTDNQGIYSHSATEYVSEGGSLSAGSYLDAPPQAKSGFVIVRQDNGWGYVANHRSTYYNIETGKQVEHTELGELPQNLTKMKPLDVPCKWDGSQWVKDEAKQAEINAQTLHQLTESIDNKATTIYTTWTRFESEYKARQAAAEAFKAANYQGEPSIYITSFAVPAGVDNKTATDIILQQAAGLQKLQDHLSVLRMRKYELKHPDLTTAQMQAIHDDIIKQMDDLMEAYQNG
ncbi:hypothetical protein [Haemophilus haemolyticus]|uniref:hypothetical protein n=1 Tax=Haemophilus haemolyticus TaxID=726 RepID=UPI000E5770C1|nr:hypothetical protein [Haemophilus haemolyticus]